MGVLESLTRSRKFWLAMLALAQTILFQFVPDFPAEVWQAIDGVLIVLIASIAAEDVAEKRAGKVIRGTSGKAIERM